MNSLGWRNILYCYGLETKKLTLFHPNSYTAHLILTSENVSDVLYC